MTAKDDLDGAAGVSLSQVIAEEEEADEDQADDPGSSRVDVRQLVGGGDRPARPEVDAGWDFGIPLMVLKYLKPDEERAIPVRQHPALLILPALVFLGGLLAAIALNGWAYETNHNPPIVFHAIWIIWVAGALWAVYQYVLWRQTWFVVTGHRVMLIETTKWLGRKVTMLPIDKLRDCEYTQTALGRVIGYGTFRFSSIGTERALQEVVFLPYPEWIYQQISELTMPAGDRKAIKRNR
jgi:membrane protein YdbS with pleckstrin-like domain